MSEKKNPFDVSLLMADFVNIDAVGKLNVIGGAVSGLGFNPETGFSTAFALAAIVTADETVEGQDFSFELTLKHESGDLVNLPGPAGPQIMRIGQNRRVPRATHRGAPVTDLVAINFDSGLPLHLGQSYFWEAQIDGGGEPHWRVKFFLPSEPQTEPVLG